jgi:tRNA(Ile2)-agmatinylcytidine synthase
MDRLIWFESTDCAGIDRRSDGGPGTTGGVESATHHGAGIGSRLPDETAFRPRRRTSDVTLVGLDDTDARAGMCTTYAAARLAGQLREAGRVGTLALVRCNPAVEHKTRGNGALCVETDVSPERALALASGVIETTAALADGADPGVVVADASFAAGGGSDDGPAVERDAVVSFARSAVRDRLTVADAERLIDVAGYHARTWDGDGLEGRGRIGALAAVGAVLGRRADAAGFTDWTYERLAYRERERWGSPREVDAASAREAAAEPGVWDTVDCETGEVICVPHTPGPVLYGVRGDDPGAVERAAAALDTEPVTAAETFLTNQGTDAHVRPARVGGVVDGRAYRVDGVVRDPPETRRGGHVHLPVGPDGESGGDATARLPCVAFEPTKRFRDHVRALRTGDRVTVVGEVGGGSLKLEKFAVRELNRTRQVVPTCPDCGRSMDSAGRGQGYRCRDCATSADGKASERVERTLEEGWYEVPPAARRHVAKPLCRGGFDAPTHPER